MSEPTPVMQRVKLVTAIIAVVLILIVCVQNTQSVETKFLFLKMTMPNVLLILFSLLIGFVLGLIAATMYLRRGKGKVNHRDTEAQRGKQT